MIRFGTLFDLEMNHLDAMSRSELVEAVLERSESLPVDLRERVQEQEPDRLRLLLFAARLIHALRQVLALRKSASQPTTGCSR